MKINNVGSGLFVSLIWARGIHAEVGTNGSASRTPDNSRIVGGNDAEIGGYPFFVEWEGCGASLIHNGECLFMLIMVIAPFFPRC